MSNKGIKVSLRAAVVQGDRLIEDIEPTSHKKVEVGVIEKSKSKKKDEETYR